MTMLKLNRVDMGSAARALDRPIWISSAAIEWFELLKDSTYSVVMMRCGESVPVREKPEEIAALLADAAPVPT